MQFISIISLLSSIALIVTVAIQEGADQGMGTITGDAAPLWGQSRGTSREDVLKRVTIVAAIVFIISNLILAAL